MSDAVKVGGQSGALGAGRRGGGVFFFLFLFLFFFFFSFCCLQFLSLHKD